MENDRNGSAQDAAVDRRITPAGALVFRDGAGVPRGRARQGDRQLHEPSAPARAIARGALMAKTGKKRKAAKARALDAVRTSDRVGPTPETAAKLKPDPLRRMHSAGQLTEAQRDAALEIALVLDVLAGRMRIHSHGQRGSGEISDLIAEVHSARYLPWVRRIGPQAAAIVYDLAVEGLIPEEIVVRRRVPLVGIYEQAQFALSSYVTLQRQTPNLDIRSLRI